MKYKYSLFMLLLLTVSITNGQVKRNMLSAVNKQVNTSQQQQLQGTVTITDPNILQQLQQNWGMPIQQAAGRTLKVELWEVTYGADQANTNNSNIYFKQKINANVIYNSSATGVDFTIQYPGFVKNLIVCLYTTIVQSNIRQMNALNNLKIKGAPNDGRPASRLHQFKSDAKKYLGNNIIYGIYSLPAGTVNFSIGSATASQNCKTCFGIDDVVNTIGDIASEAGNLVNSAINATAETLKNLGESVIVNNGIVGVECFGVIATYLQTGETPKARMLRDYGNAYDLANSTIFMGTLPPIDKIIITNLMSIDKRPFTVPIRNGNEVFILMNLGNAFYDPSNYNFNGVTGDVFIHELTHAWQIWHIDNLRLFVDGAVNQFKNTVISNQYSYQCNGHNITDSYNEEQQAMIVENFYSIMFYHPDVVKCGFEQQWTVQNIIRNNQSNINALYTATTQMLKLAMNRTLQSITGGINTRTLAVHSNGNKTDGDGFFFPGKTSNTFYYYSNKKNTAAANWGAIRDKYAKAGYEFGELGWPDTTETLLPDGKGFFQRFNHGYIYWNPAYGAYIVKGKIFSEWAHGGWERGALGYPLSDYVPENPAPVAPVSENAPHTYSGYQKFEGGVIFYSKTTGGVIGLRETCTSELGNPDKILAMHLSKQSTIVTNYKNTGQPADSSSNLTDKVKNMPPRVIQKNSATNKKGNSSINPQPLPPKVKSQQLKQ